ncbi:MAG: hypothetical protein BGO51_03730 [Rhodospirillales bacterium 69-11]|nr:hypothetical protein [Rhodospirillales bacterium]OJW28354.1 MAG: hypothetical protein BGO51_03730 [Rhodospirillales bacterium 69-11]
MATATKTKKPTAKAAPKNAAKKPAPKKAAAKPVKSPTKASVTVKAKSPMRGKPTPKTAKKK